MLFIYKRVCCVLCLLILVPSSVYSLATPPQSRHKPTTTNTAMPTRKTALTRFASLTSLLLWDPLGANAFAASNSKQPSFAAAPSNDVAPTSVAYRSMQVDVTGTRVPVAMWFPINSDTQQPTTTYQHNISVKRIGQLLAGWDFIPDFASKQFALPSTAVDGTNIAPPTKSPVVLLAHGYLGSRFDLSHLAEALAREGTRHRTV